MIDTQRGGAILVVEMQLHDQPVGRFLDRIVMQELLCVGKGGGIVPLMFMEGNKIGQCIGVKTAESGALCRQPFVILTGQQISGIDRYRRGQPSDYIC